VLVESVGPLIMMEEEGWVEVWRGATTDGGAVEGVLVMEVDA